MDIAFPESSNGSTSFFLCEFLISLDTAELDLTLIEDIDG